MPGAVPGVSASRALLARLQRAKKSSSTWGWAAEEPAELSHLPLRLPPHFSGAFV